MRRPHPQPDPVGPGQVSVWSFPRPPRVERVDGRVRVELGGTIIADTTRALRVCETASPPTYYVPADDTVPGTLAEAPGHSICEWKGRARYWRVRAAGRDVARGAWSYPEPLPAFEALRGYVAFYAGRMDACFVGDARVDPQEGPFYGGWITPDVVGPFKGPPGTEHW